MRRDGTLTRIIKVTGGTLTTLVSATTTALADGSVLYFTAIGNQLTGYLNGAQMVQVSDSTYPSNKRAGVYQNVSSGFTTTCDNWSAGTLDAGSLLSLM